MVGQASSLSIRDDGQDARPTGNLWCMRLLRSARNDKLSPALTEGLLCFLPSCLLEYEINKCVP